MKFIKFFLINDHSQGPHFTQKLSGINPETVSFNVPLLRIIYLRSTQHNWLSKVMNTPQRAYQKHAQSSTRSIHTSDNHRHQYKTRRFFNQDSSVQSGYLFYYGNWAHVSMVPSSEASWPIHIPWSQSLRRVLLTCKEQELLISFPCRAAQTKIHNLWASRGNARALRSVKILKQT